MFNIREVEDIFYQIAFKGKTYKILEKELNLGVGSLFREMKKYRGFFKLKDGERYGKITYLRYKYGEEIKNEYLDGASTEYLGKKYSCSDRTIAAILKTMNIDIRPSGRESKTNQNVFSSIDSNDKAYVVGLITADGSVNDKGSITLCLTENDKYLLDDINYKVFNSTGNIFISHEEDKKPRYILNVNGKKICNDLSNFYIVPRKTYLLHELSMAIPPEFYSDYIRGLYDGDGICAKTNNLLRVGYCAYNKDFVQSYQDFLCKTLEMRKNKIFNTGNCWQCSWSAKSDLLKFYSYIYNTPSQLFLKRKKEKLENYLFYKANTEVSIF